MTNDDSRPSTRYEANGDENAAEMPSADTLFWVLSHERRRRILGYLADNPETTLSELADALVERDAESAENRGDEHRRMRTSLHHHHLPMLAESGLIAYDTGTGAIRFASPPPIVEELIRFSRRYERDSERTATDRNV